MKHLIRALLFRKVVHSEKCIVIILSLSQLRAARLNLMLNWSTWPGTSWKHRLMFRLKTTLNFITNCHLLLICGHVTSVTLYFCFQIFPKRRIRWEYKEEVERYQHFSELTKSNNRLLFLYTISHSTPAFHCCLKMILVIPGVECLVFCSHN